MQKSKIILVGGWTRLYQIIKHFNVELTVLHSLKEISLIDLELIDNLISFDVAKIDQQLEILKSIHNLNPFNYVISFEEKWLLTAAAIKEGLNIGGNPINPVNLTRNKALMRDFLSEIKFPHRVPCKIIKKREDIIGFLEEVSFGIIIKPVKGTGSKGVYKISSIEEMELIENKIDFYSEENAYIAEQYIEGTEISVEAFSWGGEHKVLSVTDKFTTGTPNFIELGHLIPSQLPEDKQLEVNEIVISFLKAINHDCGPSHTELKVNDQGIFIIESHTRAGGDYIYDLVEMSTGLNVFEKTIRCILGETDLDTTYKNKTFSLIKFFNFPAGVVKSINGINEARSINGVVRLNLEVNEGMLLKEISQSSDRHGYVIIKGNTKDELLLTLDKVIEVIEVEII